MKKLFALFITCWLASIPSLKAAEAIIVVANTSDKSLQLNRLQVRNQTRVLFNTKVIGLTESRIQSYWAQMRFTGRKKAPREFSNEQSMLDYLIDNAGAVGYLPEGISVPNELTVLYTVR